MFDTDKEAGARAYLAILKAYKPDPNPTRSKDVQLHAVADLFLSWNLGDSNWSKVKVLALSQWIETQITDQLYEAKAQALRVDFESVYDLFDHVGESVARKALALAGVFSLGRDWRYGDAAEAESQTAKGHIPPYRAHMRAA